ncbi:hypothetical protein B0H13DRAFT_2078522, partial [Mycena leptocephala]
MDRTATSFLGLLFSPSTCCVLLGCLFRIDCDISLAPILILYSDLWNCDNSGSPLNTQLERWRSLIQFDITGDIPILSRNFCGNVKAAERDACRPSLACLILICSCAG